MRVDHHGFRRPAASARRALAATALWLGSALLTGAIAADNGYRVVAGFTPEQGNMLNGALLQDAAGDLYVTAMLGGARDRGSVARVSLDGQVTVLHSFDRHRQGLNPQHGLIWASDGFFYGSTMAGGAVNQGTIFRMAPDGTLTTLHSFVREADGAFPSKLLQAGDGNFYGTTPSGGQSERGTIFRITPAGQFEVLHHFIGQCDPAQPTAELIQGRDGLLYGTSLDGGCSGGGTIFRIGLDGGGLVVLHRFNDLHGGRFPGTALVEASDGNFYGTTKFGADADAGGTAYRIHEKADGARPDGALIQAANGDFYGTTTTGGPRGGGTVFRMKADGSLLVLHGFSWKTERSHGPRGALLQGKDGLLYGTTGHFTAPTVFRQRAK
jgi:uncharacterized repeat protein (TIGR03803 family)